MIGFVKMHGIGNDFVMVDAVSQDLRAASLPDLARSMCHRRFGVGSDGLILVEKGAQAPLRMRMFNPDGSESEMCGNGVRCFARFVLDRGLWSEPAIPVETGAGVLTLQALEDGRVRVDMGIAKMSRGAIGMAAGTTEEFIAQPVEALGRQWVGTAVSMGNPHLVIVVDDASEVPLEVWGPALEHSELFPNRVNVHFVQILGPDRILQRTWERGAGATLACGTGACASAVAARVNGHTGPKVEVTLPGGKLDIEVREDDRVFMTGPAETVFEGSWP